MSSPAGSAEHRIEEVFGELTNTDKFRERGSTARVHGKGQQDARTTARNKFPKIARPPLGKPSEEYEHDISYDCPICRDALPYLTTLPPVGTPCFKSGAFLWCRRRDSPEGVVLEAVPGRTPKSWEVELIVDSLGRHGTLDRVTLDLSKLEIVDSSYVGALVGMRKRLQASGCALLLYGLSPVVLEIFGRLRLNRLFGILKS